MSIQAEVDPLQRLFSATFVLILVASPLFGWLNSVAPRAQFVDAWPTCKPSGAIDTSLCLPAKVT